MSLFKQRLIELLASVIVTAIVLGVLAGSFWLLTLLHPNLPAIICIVLLVLMAVFYVGCFINWLFIAPFRKDKAK
jgi:hypothetical protein